MAEERHTLIEEEALTTRLLEPAGWRLSWGAVVAGVIVALVSHILLNLLGLGIGAVAAEPSQPPSADTVEKVGLAAALWWAGTGIVAAGLGGWFAGRAMGSADRDDGAIHGLLSWAATTLIVAFFLTSVLGGALAGALGRVEFRDTPSLQQSQQGQPPTAADPGKAAADAAKQTTPQQRETAQEAVAGSALASFVALVLGAIAAWFAGGWGVSSARKALEDD